MGGRALSRGGVGLRWRGLATAWSSLVLIVGLATGAAAQTCATTDTAITGVTPAPSDPAALAGDCTTLLGVKDTLRGTGALNWANNLSMASWDGITLASNKNRVAQLELINKSLTGSVPDLSALAGLQRLWINGNELTGGIVAARFPTSLRSLQLAGNRLTGSVPDLSALTSLQDLRFGTNELTGSIAATHFPTSLQFLQLHSNKLTGNVPDLSALTSLQDLTLNSNKLTGSIPDLSTLTSLTRIALGANELTGNVVGAHFPASLRTLILSVNKLAGSVPDLSALTSLQWLQLNDNQLTGSIDASKFPTSLTHLFLPRNQLNGSFPNLSALTGLTQLFLHQNQLSGPLPTWWGSLPDLQWLLLAGNPLSGGIPSQLGSLSNLTHLSLCGSDLDATATLPSALETRRTTDGNGDGNNDLSVWSCLRIEDATATEGSLLRFAVEHSTYPVRGVAGATGGLTLGYQTEDGTATSADYSGTVEGRVTIPANRDSDDSTSSAAISVPTIIDAIDDSGETLTVTLRPAAPATRWGPLHPLRRTATGTILNNRAPPPNRPPRVTLSCEPCQVELGGEAMLTAKAWDPDNDPLSYEWSASGGLFNGAADTATVGWTAPDTVGAVTIRVTVSDGEGGTDSASVTLDVLAMLPEKLSFDIPHLGAASFSTAGDPESPRVGYGQIRPDPGRATPSGMALFGLRNRQGLLITEASVPASRLVRWGRIFAEVGGPVRTAVAFANPNGRPANIDFYVTDTAGNRIVEESFVLEAYQHLAGFLNAEPYNLENVVGTFTFRASVPVAAMGLWELTNAPGECLVATLPVLPQLPPPYPFPGNLTDPMVAPHLADGDGWGTRIILVNPTWDSIAGRLEFLGQNGAPLAMMLADGRLGTSFEYAIPPNGAQIFRAVNPPGRPASASVRATPARGTTPQGLLLSTFASDGKTTAAAAVPALRASTGFRVPVEAAGIPGQPGSIGTGLAIANTTDEEVRVGLEILRPDGSLAPPLGSLTLPPRGQTSRMLDAIMDLPEEFSSGLLRVTATGPVALAALRLRINRRGELKATSIRPSNELAPAATQDRWFAHLADTPGWTTDLVLFSGTAGETSSGNLCLFWFPVP